MLNTSFEFSQKDLDLFFEPIKTLEHIGLGVSGGVDSVALMFMVFHWAKTKKTPPKIMVYSVNHGLRDEAINECEFVKGEAKKLGFKTQVLTWGEKPKSALQENARKARYKLIGQAMARNNTQILLTAHHAFDQAETILMRMANGSGIKGLVGMDRFSQVENIKIFRPLLDVPPDRLAKIIEKAGIKAIKDPSNFDEKYERVRWRKMLPSLFALGLNEERLNKFSARLKRATIALDEMSNSLFSEKVEIDDFGVARILKTELEKVVEELQIRLIQKLLQKVGGKQKPFALNQIEELTRQIIGRNFKKQTLHGCIIEQKKNHIIFAREISKIQTKEIKLTDQKEIIWDNRFLIKNKSKNKYIIYSGVNFTKKDYQNILNKKITLTLMQIQSAPIIVDERKNVVFIGKFTINEKLSKDLEVKII